MIHVNSDALSAHTPARWSPLSHTPYAGHPRNGFQTSAGQWRHHSHEVTSGGLIECKSGFWLLEYSGTIKSSMIWLNFSFATDESTYPLSIISKHNYLLRESNCCLIATCCGSLDGINVPWRRSRRWTSAQNYLPPMRKCSQLYLAPYVGRKDEQRRRDGERRSALPLCSSM